MNELSEHRIGTHDAFYIPEFVTVEEEEYLIRKIAESPVPRWKQLAKRRLQIWGGEISRNGILIEQPLPSFIQKTPDLISRIKETTGVFEGSAHGRPNHVIMNEYLPGQGIMPHEDGPQYHPVVATISLGSHSVFHYYQYHPDSDDSETAGLGKSINMTPVLSLLLEPRSLVISSGAMYTSHLHGIDEVKEDGIKSDSNPTGVEIANMHLLRDEEISKSIQIGEPLKRQVRYSLTCRDVERVSTIGSRFHR